MRLKLAVFDTVELKIEFDGVVSSRRNGDALAAENGDSCEIGGSGGVHHDALNVALLKGLAAKIEQGRLEIEEPWKIVPPNFRSSSRRFGDFENDAGG